MILARNKSSDKTMTEQIIDKLDRSKIDDYEVTSRIPSDVCSVEVRQSEVAFHVPKKIEYFKYDLDEKIRSVNPNGRTRILPDIRSSQVQVAQPVSAMVITKVIEYIISELGFCSIVKSNI